MPQFYICNQDEIKLKLKTLIETETFDGGWTHLYVDQNNGDRWLLTYHDSERQGGGVSILKKLPQQTIKDLIEIAVTSKDKNDIKGCSIELREREKFNSQEFRDMLIKRLLQFDIHNLADFDKDRLVTIINESQLQDPVNKKEIVGKHWKEVQKDGEYYLAISQKAKQILNEINKYSS